MAEKRTEQMVSDLEAADRRHSAEPEPPAPALSGDEQVPRAERTAQDDVARAAGALGPATETDPLALMSHDDRPGQGGRRHRRGRR